MTDELERLRTRVAWLENEMEHMDGVVTTATAYRRWMQRSDSGMISHSYVQLVQALDRYWTETLDDDGLEEE
jgi:hypothetical protein